MKEFSEAKNIPSLDLIAYPYSFGVTVNKIEFVK